jgi:hypothetical protein
MYCSESLNGNSSMILCILLGTTWYTFIKFSSLNSVVSCGPWYSLRWWWSNVYLQRVWVWHKGSEALSHQALTLTLGLCSLDGLAQTIVTRWTGGVSGVGWMVCVTGGGERGEKGAIIHVEYHQVSLSVRCMLVPNKKICSDELNLREKILHKHVLNRHNVTFCNIKTVL